MKTGSLNISYIATHNNRFEGRYYLNDFAYNSMIIERHSESCVKICELADAFNPPVFKRQFCREEGNSIAYYQSSDIATLQRSNVFIFKYQAEKLNLVVYEGDILIAGFGTVIGDTCIALKIHNGACFANNVCRLRTYDGVKKGYIAAFLKSKYGSSLLNNNASGSAIRYIEAPRIKQLLIPWLDDSIQDIADNLMMKSIKLREEASDALNRAVNLFEEAIGPSKVNLKFNYQIINSELISSKFCRFDSQYQIGKAQQTKFANCKKIGSIALKINIGNRGKRNYVKNGIPFLSSSDIMLANPLRNCKYISKHTPSLSDMIVNKGDILISRSGTVGNTIIVGRTLSGVAVSEHAMRLVVDANIISPEYVFAYFMTKHGHDALQVLPYGSVIVTLGEDFLADVDLPILDQSKINSITEHICSYIEKQDLSIEKENKAIRMVEEEIEKWNN